MDILSKHYVESLKVIVPQLQDEIGALKARIEELEDAARRKGGRPRKVAEVLPMGEAN